MKDTKSSKESSKPKLRRYIPLMVVIALAALGASAIQCVVEAPGPHSWMHGFMGLFLLVFSMLKLFDLPGFAEGFEMYDLLAG